MLRIFGWIVSGGILLGAASIANAQAPQSAANPGGAYGYSGLDAYGDLSARGYSGSSGGTGQVVTVVGSHRNCYTLYPLSTITPYTYAGPGTVFGASKPVPYPYAPIGYGRFGEHWRGW